MMKMKREVLGAIATAALCVSGAAMAGGPFSGMATLATPVAAPSETQVDGVTWHCEADKCTGQADNRSTLDSHMKECRKVAAALGELTSYKSRGREMTQSSVKSCNRAATTK
jgi:hypothetical protein